ncbi:MAG: von Willebrand factor type A domain-containing protein, partial [Phycisphaerales bacterium JB063]
GFVAANGRVVTEEKLSLAQNPAGVHLESIVDAPAAMAPQEEAPDNAARLDLFEPLGEPYAPGDNYALVHDNPFHTGINDPLSTFSVDVDTAAYAIVRRQLVQQQAAPVPEAVRIEELINYFGYDYAAPVVEPELLENGVVTQSSLERLAADDNTFAPFATHIEVTDCPWTQGHQLVRIGIKGMEVAQEDRPAAHLTFLLDVSGSMNRENKLPLVKESLKMLLGQLNADDHVSIVVYAGAAGLVLEHASAADVHAIEEALDKLSAGGSTAGGAGIELAYDIAQKHYVDGGVNRVILCTDGDFNVGISDRDALVDLIQDKANPEPGDDGQTRGVYLSAMGFGFGNLNDNMMEPLTNAGNGNYAYIDTADEAHKVMVEQVGGTLVAIAKDVKIQVEFNPSQVLAYRLIGYENRILAAEDFANDTVDAGDIGAGHTVTALYEVVPFPDDGLGDEESLRMVKEQIEALDEALAFSTSVLDNTPLTAEQYDKLVGSIRMMQQQRSVALALESRAKRRLPDIAADGIDMRYRDGRAFVDGLDDMDELLVVNLRYKPVDAPAQQGTSRLIQTPVGLSSVPFEEASEDTRFAAAVAGFGMVLRHSPHRGEADMQWVLDTAGSALGDDAFGYRAGFVSLVEQAAQLVPDDAEKDRNVIAPREGRQPIERRRELGR